MTLTVETLRLALIGLPGDATIRLHLRADGRQPINFGCWATSTRFVDEDQALEVVAELGGVVGTW